MGGGERGRLFKISADRRGAYSKGTLIQGEALIRGFTVNQTHFHFARGLVLKQRHMVSRKWPFYGNSVQSYRAFSHDVTEAISGAPKQ